MKAARRVVFAAAKPTEPRFTAQRLVEEMRSAIEEMQATLERLNRYGYNWRSWGSLSFETLHEKCLERWMSNGDTNSIRIGYFRMLIAAMTCIQRRIKLHSVPALKTVIDETHATFRKMRAALAEVHQIAF